LVDVKNAGRFPLRGQRFIIGRSNVNHIEVKDSLVSRVHALITVEDGQYFLDDLGSTNGTFLNGTAITRRQPLNDRDTIRLGESIFTFVQRTSTANMEETKELMHL
jgi:pSer/pThr/pTyr-binding forkhead associated (FHA) protein